jgi:nucleoside 2-deoxyribosyltransferase
MTIDLYIASESGFCPESKMPFYLEKMLPLIVRAGYNPVCPWALNAKVAEKALKATDDNKVTAWRAANRIIYMNNRHALDNCDGVVAILNGMHVDDGVCWEVGYTIAKGKRVLGYRDDFRPAGDNPGCRINLMLEESIIENGTIVANLKDLKHALPVLFPKTTQHPRHKK